MRYVAAIAVALTAVFVTAPAAAPESSATVERRTALEAAVIREMNTVRVAEGLRPLHASPSLRTAARGHSRAMLEHGFFAHESSDGTAFSERIRRHYTNRGWMKWSVGEALLSGTGDTLEPRAIVAAWLDSPSHREILLSPTWRDAGIGALYAPTAPNEYRGAETIVVTADFGLREGRITTITTP
jgi:uncharacterized protein YkwD